MTVQFCTQCGHAIGAHEQYCAMCGADVSGMTAVVDGPHEREQGLAAQPIPPRDSHQPGGPAARSGIVWMYFSIEGRINRTPYWTWNIPLIAFSLFFEYMAATTLNQAWYFLDLALVPASLMLGVKRAHDRNRSGWFLLLSFVPVLNLWPLIELGFLRGTVGTNDYGPDPLALAGPWAGHPPAA
jgi:uncharacterized membrane protein YhaH (DUF805 family)